MDLLSELHALIAPARIGESLDGDTRLLDVSAELGMRFLLEHQGSEVAIEVDPITEGRRHAARSKYFGFAYRLGDRAAPIDSELGRSLCELVAARAMLNEESVLARLRVEAGAESGPRIREVRGPRLLERGGSLGERYWTVSPYVGCLIGCRFCYAPSRLDPVRRLAGLAPVAWGSWVDVRVDAPEVLARELTTLPPLPIKFCPIVSDPYQAIESKLRLTRQCLEVLRDAPPRDVMVLTRAASIVEDAALLASIPRAWAGVSLPTVNDEVRRHFEPRGAAISDRLAALATLRAAGVRTFAIVQPLFPGSIDELAEALAAHVESVRIDVLHGTYAAAEDFAAFPHVADPAWQQARADELATALQRRGVKLWPGELPP